MSGPLAFGARIVSVVRVEDTVIEWVKHCPVPAKRLIWYAFNEIGECAICEGDPQHDEWKKVGNPIAATERE